MELKTIADLLPAALTGTAYSPITALAYDSRRVQPGALFAALDGAKQRGAEFIAAAIAKGAVAVLGDQPLTSPLPVPYLQVQNARAALARIAQAFYDYPARRLRLVGITGTNGKTTTAYLLRYLWRELGTTAGMLGTIEYDLAARKIPAPLTTPESVDFAGYLREAVDAGAAAMAAEVSSHALALDRVVGEDFAAAIFTNLTRDHLDYHGTLANYAAAKQKLFRALPSAAAAVINADDPYGKMMVDGAVAKVITYGVNNPDAEWNATAPMGKITGNEFLLTGAGKTYSVFLPLCGAHNIHNALAAIAALTALGWAPEKVIEALANFPGVPGRLERLSGKGKNVFIDYAHTPDALEKVLQTVRRLTSGKLWVVFGCGGDRDKGKRPLMAQAAEKFADGVVVTSDNPRTENAAAIIADIRAGFAHPAAPRYEIDRAEAIRIALTSAVAGDAIIIAGKGHEDYQIIGAEKFPFSDRETAARFLVPQD